MIPTPRILQGHSLHAILNYIGGDEGDSIVRWYRVESVDTKRDGATFTEIRETLVAEQVMAQERVWTLNPQPETRNPKPETLNIKP